MNRIVITGGDVVSGVSVLRIRMILGANAWRSGPAEKRQWAAPAMPADGA
ncbi:MAG: hypothetical protein ABWX93_11025 [Pseudoxanthomonas sp.]